MNIDLDKEIAKITQGVTEMDCSGAVRDDYAARIANKINEVVHPPVLNCNAELFRELKENGIVALSDINLNNQHVNEIVDYFKNKPAYSGHIPQQSDGVPRNLQQAAKASPFGSYLLEDILQAPHLLELALNPTVLGLVQSYLGCVPTVYSFNTWWSFPGHPPMGPQDFHRDIDDFKFLALFIYLTDVEGGEAGGEHQFITQTHDDAKTLEILGGNTKLASSFFLPNLRINGYGQDKKYNKYFSKQKRTIVGKAGSVFLADTFAFHKGVPPLKSDRLVCWIRFGLRKNLTYGNDKLRHIHPSQVQNRIQLNDINRYMLRLMVSEEPVLALKPEDFTHTGPIYRGQPWELSSLVFRVKRKIKKLIGV